MIRPLPNLFVFLLSFTVFVTSCTSQQGVELETQAVVTPQEIPRSAPEIANPMRGFYQWYGSSIAPQPGYPFMDTYTRYEWKDLETSKGVYDFSKIKNDIAAAKAKRAKHSFAIMAVNSFGAESVLPAYMMREVPGDYCTYNSEYQKTPWEVERVWVPDWDSAGFIERARALVQALGREFNGDVEVAYYDMGVYGHWGEWHAWPFVNCTTAGEATEATKRTLANMQLTAFSQTRILVNTGDHNAEVFTYLLERDSKLGVRMNSLNWPWFDDQLTLHPEREALVKERWKTAPLVVEFGGGWLDEDSKNFSLAKAQVKRWHVAALANGNSYNWDEFTNEQKRNFVMTGKRSGYRFVPREFRYPNIVTRGATIRLVSKWSNMGVTPLYERFIVRYELRLKGQNAVAWWGNSGLDLQKFLPTVNSQGTDTPKTVTDAFTLQTLAPGTYTLSLVILDPTGYRDKLALAIEGRTSSGRYLIGDITIR
jgi:hypothetical protein